MITLVSWFDLSWFLFLLLVDAASLFEETPKEVKTEGAAPSDKEGNSRYSQRKRNPMPTFESVVEKPKATKKKKGAKKSAPKKAKKAKKAAPKKAKAKKAKARKPAAPKAVTPPPAPAPEAAPAPASDMGGYRPFSAHRHARSRARAENGSALRAPQRLSAQAGS